MDKSVFEDLLSQGLSQREIGRFLGRSQTNVRYWLMQFNLVEKTPKKFLRQCLYCGKDISRHSQQYCSNKCQQDFEWSKAKRTIENNGFISSRRQAKRYLLECNGHNCSICGLTHWLGKPILLILDHIDGNSDNWSLLNIRLICSNCDATLPTYKARNKGNGRHYRKERYKQGKSY